jgi:hypothetical protein
MEKRKNNEALHTSRSPARFTANLLRETPCCCDYLPCYCILDALLTTNTISAFSLSFSLPLSLSLCPARSNFTKTAHLAICYLLWENIDITAVLLLAFVGTRDAGNLRESLLQESLESVSSRTERIFPL